MIINKMPIKLNFSKRINSLKYIVVHDTGNTNPTAGAISHYKYFNSGYRAASAHYFVDDCNIIETIDPHLVAWHCGDGRNRNGISNSNSIGMEICVNSNSNFSLACAQATELIRFLMSVYNIPKSRVVRHFDASGKICPYSMSKDNWKLWKEFLRNI